MARRVTKVWTAASWHVYSAPSTHALPPPLPDLYLVNQVEDANLSLPCMLCGRVGQAACQVRQLRGGQATCMLQLQLDGLASCRVARGVPRGGGGGGRGAGC